MYIVTQVYMYWCICMVGTGNVGKVGNRNMESIGFKFLYTGQRTNERSLTPPSRSRPPPRTPSSPPPPPSPPPPSSSPPPPLEQSDPAGEPDASFLLSFNSISCPLLAIANRRRSRSEELWKWTNSRRGGLHKTFLAP